LPKNSKSTQVITMNEALSHAYMGGSVVGTIFRGDWIGSPIQQADQSQGLREAVCVKVSPRLVLEARVYPRVHDAKHMT